MSGKNKRDGGRLTQLSLIPSHMASGDQSDEKKTSLDLKKNLSFLHSKLLSQCFLFISFSSKRFEQIPFLYPIIPQCVHTTNFAGSCERDYCFPKTTHQQIQKQIQIQIEPMLLAGVSGITAFKTLFPKQIQIHKQIQIQIQLILLAGVSGIRGCSHITSAKNRSS